MRAMLVGLICVVLVGWGPGCGGGGGGTGGDGPPTVVLYSAATADGYVTDTNIYNVTAAVDVGDQDGFLPGTNIRGFVSFSLAPIPFGATITSATLRCYQTGANVDPYGKLGTIVLDHVDYGTTLDGDEYGIVAIALDLGTLSLNSSVGWKTLDVTSAVANALAGAHPRCQFRLRFTSETTGDVVHDRAHFEAGDNSTGTGNRPELVVTYTQ